MLTSAGVVSWPLFAGHTENLTAAVQLVARLTADLATGSQNVLITLSAWCLAADVTMFDFHRGTPRHA